MRDRTAGAGGRCSASHSYPGFWLGAGVLGLLSVSCLWGGLGMLASPPAPGRPGPPADAGPILAGAGLAFLVPALLLGWLAVRSAERFDADRAGITWYRGGRLRARLRWDEITRVRLENPWTRLVIEGPPGTPPLTIGYHLRNFRRLLGEVQRATDWERLVAGPVHPIASGEAQREGLSLPFVHRQRLELHATVVGTLACLAFSVFLWLPSGTLGKPAPNHEPPEVRARDQRGETFVTYATPLVTVWLGYGLLTCLTGLRIDPDGIELTYLSRQRRFAWKEIQSVGVRLRRLPSQHTMYNHALVVKPLGQRDTVFWLRQDPFAVRDLMVAAAARAGVNLPVEHEPSDRRPG